VLSVFKKLLETVLFDGALMDGDKVLLKLFDRIKRFETGVNRTVHTTHLSKADIQLAI